MAAHFTKIGLYLFLLIFYQVKGQETVSFGLSGSLTFKSSGQNNETGFPIKKTILKLEQGSSEWVAYKDYSFEYY